MAGEAHIYSTLEAVYPGRQPYRQGTLLPSDAGKQVVPDDDKRLVTGSEGLEAVAKDSPEVKEIGGNHILKLQVPRRRWLLFGAVAALVMIPVIILAAAVIGGVLGSRNNNHSDAAASTTPTSSPLPNSSPTSSLPSNSSATTVPIQRNIAAVSYSLNSVNNTRVYYQDDLGQLTESANSENNASWSSSGTGTFGMNGSAVAAAVSRPNFPLEISLFYVDAHYVIHDIKYNFSLKSWSAGTISSQGYTISPNSSLSAMYNQCSLCANTKIVAFQDENGSVQVANLTTGGWSLTQVNLDPLLGTGLALQPFYRPGLEDQINLYHQKVDLNMSLASWKPAQVNGGEYGWSVSEQIYYVVAPRTPIAAASSYTNLSTGYETWIEVLSLSNTGVEVDTWSGAINDWLQHEAYPSAMSNSTGNAKTYGSIAVTATGSAFAVTSQKGQKDVIEWSQVADDMLHWTYISNILVKYC